MRYDDIMIEVQRRRLDRTLRPENRRDEHGVPAGG